MRTHGIHRHVKETKREENSIILVPVWVLQKRLASRFSVDLPILETRLAGSRQHGLSERTVHAPT